MRKTCSIILILCLAGALTAQTTEADKEAIKQAAMDYMDGAHEGNAEREIRALHPELNKLSLRTLPNGKAFLAKSGYSQLVELVRANVAPLEPEKRNINVTIYSAKEGIACVKVVSAVFHDYLHLAKIDGDWKLVNVLWTYNPAYERKGAPPRTEKTPAELTEDIAAVKQASLDYIEGYFSGDGDRMARAVHPALNKVIPTTLPQTGKTLLQHSGADLLIEATYAKMGLLDESKRNIELTVHDMQDEIALVEIMSAMFVDYLQLAKINGQWKIVNVLWKTNPEKAIEN